MRIALVSESYGPTISGGEELDMKLQAGCLLQRGHEITVLAFDEEANREETIAGIKVVRHRRIDGLTATAQLLTLLPQVALAMRKWQDRVDLFHVYHPPALPGAGIYKVLGGRRPVVASLEFYAAFCPIGTALCPDAVCGFSQRVRCLARGRKPALKPLSVPYAAACPALFALARRADRYIALSQVVKELYVAHGYPADRMDVIPNYVERQAVLFTARVADERSAPNILYVGALFKAKGVDVLIRAFSRLAEHDTCVRLTIVGGGDQAQPLKELVLQLGLGRRVIFAGWVPHEMVGQYYTTADVFVHPGIWAEPFGRTILEAMQFQVPLVVSNVGAPPSTVGDAGLVFEPGSVDDLAQKLETVCRDKDLRQRLSASCPRVLEAYEQDKVLGRILELYHQVLGEQ